MAHGTVNHEANQVHFLLSHFSPPSLDDSDKAQADIRIPQTKIAPLWSVG
jgi:hypothetical protein